MSHLAVESTSVQFPLVEHAADVGWVRLSDTDALSKRRGEGGLFLYDELAEALLRLNPGVVTTAEVNGIIQRMESVPNTMEGNRELLQWLRGQKTHYVEAEKRHRNVRVIDYDNAPGNNIFHVSWNGPIVMVATARVERARAIVPTSCL